MSVPVTVAEDPRAIDVCIGAPDAAVTSRISDAEAWDPFLTKTGPVIALAGTDAVSAVDVEAPGVTSTVPDAVVNTTESPALNAVPARFTEDPAATRVGEIDVSETVAPVIRELIVNENGVPSDFSN
jgi:hypothetical protein